MDKAFENDPTASVDSLGFSFYSPLDDQDQADVLPFLKQPKLRKYLSKQDRLAVVAFAQLLNQITKGSEEVLSRSGLYLCVGYIPFEENTIKRLASESQLEGQFSMDAFTSSGISSINPLTTFKCLPNMPAYHISSTFSLQGPSFTTYPGPGQFYQAMEMALLDLEMGKVDYAFVGAVCDQNNYLVKNFHDRIDHKNILIDAAGFCCLSNPKTNEKINWGSNAWTLDSYSINYESFDPLKFGYAVGDTSKNHFGAVDFFHSFENNQVEDASLFRHQLLSMDGFDLKSQWSRKVMR